ncbi:caspase family protein [Curvibacter sp. AEP1-3]|uniref:caspase family protein n=1 Tax=Curvibacter sp. AEP1-3 TaxID=1844971 RepID=UPI0018DFF151|nr:caspase family protein [Curvibacter sp. AEP1-3]
MAVRWAGGLAWVDALGSVHPIGSQGQVLAHLVTATPARLLAIASHPNDGFITIHPQMVLHHRSNGQAARRIDLPKTVDLATSPQLFIPVVHDGHLVLPIVGGLLDIDLDRGSATPLLTDATGRLQHAVRLDKRYFVISLNTPAVFLQDQPLNVDYWLLDSEGSVLEKVALPQRRCLTQGLAAQDALMHLCRASAEGGDFEVWEIGTNIRRRIVSQQKLLPDVGASSIAVARSWQQSPSVNHGVFSSPPIYGTSASLYLPGIGMVLFSVPHFQSKEWPAGVLKAAAQPDEKLYQYHQLLESVDFLHGGDAGLWLGMAGTRHQRIHTTAFNAAHAQQDADGLSLSYPNAKTLRLSATELPRLLDALPPPTAALAPTTSLRRFPDVPLEQSQAFDGSRPPNPMLLTRLMQRMLKTVTDLGLANPNHLAQVLTSRYELDIALGPNRLYLPNAGSVVMPGLGAQDDRGTLLVRNEQVIQIADLAAPQLQSLLGLQVPTHNNVAFSEDTLRSLSGIGGVWCQSGSSGSAAKVPGVDAYLFDLNGVAYGISGSGEMFRFAQCRATAFERLPAPVRRLRVQHQTAFLLLEDKQVFVFDGRNLRPQPDKYGLMDVAADPQGNWLGFDGQMLRNQQGLKRAGVGVLLIAPLGKERFVVHYRDGRSQILDAALNELFTVYFTAEGPLSIAPEGFFDGSFAAAKLVTAQYGNTPVQFHQFYDLFYRPDILQAKLTGATDYVAQTANVSLEQALQHPAPLISQLSIHAPQATARRIRVDYSVQSQGGGVGEVLVFHNGKLVKNDGNYRDAPRFPLWRQGSSTPSATANTDQRLSAGTSIGQRYAPPKSLDAYGSYTDSVEIEVLPNALNDVTVMARNADNSILGLGRTISFKSELPAPEPRLWLLAIGLDQVGDKDWKNLVSPRKDATDFICHYAGQAALAQAGLRQLGCTKPGYATSLFKPKNIHVVGLLTNPGATRASMLTHLRTIARQAGPGDTFIFYVSGHGALDANSVYGIVPYDVQCTQNVCVNLLTSNDIMEHSKAIPAMTQLLIFDTCHSGGFDTKLAGLYDARLAGLARTMGLHLFAAVTATNLAFDGIKSGDNSPFTLSLLEGLATGGAPGGGGELSIRQLGQYLKQRTPKISRQARPWVAPQSPQIEHFGQDALLLKASNH